MFISRNIKNSIAIFTKKIKDFLLSSTSREALVFLFFFAIASTFWFIRALNDDYVVDIQIPVRLSNVPNNVIVTNNLPSHLTFRVKDKGSVLFGYKMGKVFAPININFNDYRQDGQQTVINTASLDRNAFSQFSSTTKTISISPDKMELIYTVGEKKKIPVSLTGSINADRRYFIVDTLIQPEKVTAYAPKKILNKLKVAYTKPVLLKDINNTTYYQIPLRPVKGVKFVPSTINLVFHTDVYSEKKIEIPVIGTNFPPNKHLLTFPSKVYVTFQVGSTLYKQIKASDFAIEISYSELEHFRLEKYPLRLTRMPQGVRNVQITPRKIDFLIEQN